MGSRRCLGWAAEGSAAAYSTFLVWGAAIRGLHPVMPMSFSSGPLGLPVWGGPKWEERAKRPQSALLAR